MSLQVTNQGETPVENWQLQFQMAQSTIDQRWNGVFQSQGLRYTVIPADWGRVVQPNQTIDMGFCAKKLGTDYLPKRLLITKSN
ncbi:MAG: hypothetical protein HC936_12900 [Leptolyngbyaceae cyanobacterium SU_3_3]|nr:hypothetical protein [Leptolyngbyaceae cyanobacterium SU_3_3]